MTEPIVGDCSMSPTMRGAVYTRRLDDGRLLTIYPELFTTAALLIDDNPAMHQQAERTGQPTETDGGADAYYQYATVADAVAAADALEPGIGEPEGWQRASTRDGNRRRVG